MSKLNERKWEKFSYVDIFDIKKGFYNKKPEDNPKGSIRFIGATDSNNGVTSYCTLQSIRDSSKTGKEPNQPLENKIFKGNAICVTNNGSVGNAYYQNKEFTCSHDINILYLKHRHMTELLGLFLSSVIMFDKYRWGYGRKWRPKRMIHSELALPVKNSLSNQDKKSDLYAKYGYVPDWIFMIDYMKNTKHTKLTTKIKRRRDFNLKTDKWQPFLLKNLVDIYSGSGVDKNKTTKEHPMYDYVTRTGENNGVVGKIDYLKEKIHFSAGDISIALGGTIGSCFLQNNDFYTGEHMVVLHDKLGLTNYSKLFLMTIIKFEASYKFTPFGRELDSHINTDFTINLPIKYKDEKSEIPEIDHEHKFSTKGFIPDWKFIDKYMKTLPYSDRI